MVAHLGKFVSGSVALRMEEGWGLGRALVLNATYEPLCVVPVRRAVILVLKEKAEVLQHRDEELHSERMSLPVPSVIRLVHFVRVPFRARAPLSRRSGLRPDRDPCPERRGSGQD